MCNSYGLCSDGLAFILMVICNFGCLLAYIHRFYTYFWFAGLPGVVWSFSPIVTRIDL